MWLLPFAQALTILATGVPPDAAGSGTSRLPEPILTRQTYFAIPFEIDQIDHPTLGAVEIQLHVSRDRGATWQHENSVTPTTKHFLFRAAGDGEYWFAVRTRDRSGSFRPPQVQDPGLRVVVDTQAPGLAIDARRGPAGEIVAKWEIQEPNIAPDSLKIQYRVGENRDWETIAVDTAALRPGVAANSGEATWWAPAGQGRVEIRAEVADAAGNRNVSHAQVLTVASAPPPDYAGGSSQFAPAKNAPIEQDSPQNDWQPSTSQPATARNNPPQQHSAARGAVGYGAEGYGGSEYGAGGDGAGGYGRGGDGAGGYGSDGSTAANEPAQRENFPPAASPYLEAENSQRGSQAPGATGWERQANPNGVAGTYPGQVDQAADSHPSGLPSRPDWPQAGGAGAPMPGAVAVQPAPAYQNQYLPGGTAGPGQRPIGRAAEETPATPRPTGGMGRVVASRLFEIDYSNPQYPAAVGRVELWGSRDGGRTWESYGFDSDSLSPMIARVPEEGTYGFKVVFHPMQGPAAQPPRPGEMPDITVHVDLTQPEVRLLGVDRAARDAQQLTIRWQASDSQLADMPVSLYYADALAGQWLPIARNLRNAGSYDWTLPPNLPARIQIRVDVEDMAGNVATAETRNGIPMVQDLPVQAGGAPQPVQIRDARPVGRSPGAGMRRF